MIALRCPGVGRPGIPRHNGGCCAAFAALDPDRRAARGVAIAPRAAVVDRPRPPHPETITVAQLAGLIEDRQRAEMTAAEPLFHDEVAVWVDTAGANPDEALALIDMARAYGIIAGWR